MARRPEARDARRARLGPPADAVLLLVPLRHRAALQAPVFLRMTIAGRRRVRVVAAERRHRVGGRLPGTGQIGGGLVQLVRHRLLDVARRVLEFGLHLLQLFELDRPIDLGLDVGNVALRLAEQRADGAGDARQLLRPDHDQRDGADEGQLVEAEIDHGARGARASAAACDQLLFVVLVSTSTVPGSSERSVPTRWVGAAGSAGVAVPSRTPSLKPLTAPPRSLPMFLSFFVPKIRTTITSTISQCQTLNEPMVVLRMRNWRRF